MVTMRLFADFDHALEEHWRMWFVVAMRLFAGFGYALEEH